MKIWVFNEGGRVTSHFFYNDTPWVSWQLRVFIFGLSFTLAYKR